VPQLNALYTDPKAPFPKHSPRRYSMYKPLRPAPLGTEPT